MKYTVILYSLLLLTLYSCDRPACTNEREVFNQYQPYDKPYKQELARLIDSSGKDAYGYWVAGYKQIGGREYMEAYVQNTTVCAVLALDITHYNDLQQFKKVKGRSYIGAGLARLQYDVHRYNDSIAFTLRDIGSILD